MRKERQREQRKAYPVKVSPGLENLPSMRIDLRPARIRPYRTRDDPTGGC